MGSTMHGEPRKRRSFTDEFKQDAVHLVTTGGYTFAAAAQSLREQRVTIYDADTPLAAARIRFAPRLVFRASLLRFQGAPESSAPAKLSSVF